MLYFSIALRPCASLCRQRSCLVQALALHKLIAPRTGGTTDITCSHSGSGSEWAGREAKREEAEQQSWTAVQDRSYAMQEVLMKCYNGSCALL